MYIHYYNKWMSFTFRNPKPPLRVCFQGVRAITSKESTSKHSMLDFCHVGLSALLARWLVLCFTRRSKSSWNLSSNTTPEARLCHFRNHFAGGKKLGSSPSQRLMPRQDTDGSGCRGSTDGVKRVWKRCAPLELPDTRPTSLHCRLQAAPTAAPAPKSTLGSCGFRYGLCLTASGKSEKLSVGSRRRSEAGVGE